MQQNLRYTEPKLKDKANRRVEWNLREALGATLTDWHQSTSQQSGYHHILNESIPWKRIAPTLQVWTADLWKWMRRAKRKKHLIYMFLPPACLLSHFLPVWCQFGTDTARGARMTLSCHCFPTNALLTPFLSPSFFPLCSFLGMAGCTKTGDCCCRLKKNMFFSPFHLEMFSFKASVWNHSSEMSVTS